MTTPKLFVAVVAVTVLSGCVSGTATTPRWAPTPLPSFVPIERETVRAATPTPTASVSTRAGDGRTVRVVSDPTITFKCRAINDDEWGILQVAAPDFLRSSGKAVDVAEGWAVIAGTAPGYGTLYALVNGAEPRMDWVEPDWWDDGVFGKIALTDGPKALETARRCFERS